jgi:hypothetical protein
MVTLRYSPVSAASQAVPTYPDEHAAALHYDD